MGVRFQTRRLNVEALDERNVPAAMITVNTTIDADVRDAVLSLREAILVSNRALPIASLSTQELQQVTGAPTASDGDTIGFALPGLGVRTISVASPLPAVSEPVTIDGYTQTGSAANTDPAKFNGVVLVKIDGLSAGTGVDGLTINADDVVIRGLAIESFRGLATESGHAIAINGATRVRVEGNLLSGNEGAGVFINDAPGNTVGGPTAAARNVLFSNRNGVEVYDVASNGNVIAGNLIGLNESGESAGQLVAGVYIRDGASNTVVGGSTPNLRNVISSNQYGVLITRSASAPAPYDNVIQGNYIGTDPAGIAALGNNTGIFVNDSPGTVVGGPTSVTGTGAGNLIVSSLYGVQVASPGSTATRIEGNRIGATAAGSVPSPWGAFYSAIHLGGANNVVGGPNLLARNLIAGANTRGGVVLAESGGHVVQNNLIGTDGAGADLGNGGGGVRIESSGNRVEVNVIAFNKIHVEEGGDPDGGGVVVRSGTGNAILANRIFGNDGLGIELVNSSTVDGVPLPNDAGDTDTGPNGLQNYPVLTSAAVGGSTAITGTLQSTPSGRFRLEFFASGTADPSGHGEGDTFLGYTEVNTDANGFATFNATVPAAPVDRSLITATATNLIATTPGDTSEFSQPVLATRARPTVTLGDVVITEGHAGTRTVEVPVTLGNSPASPVEILVAIRQGTATAGRDYYGSIATIRVPAGGSPNQRVSIRIVGDRYVEEDETFFVDAVIARNADVLDPRGVVTIVNDDTRPSIAINNVSVVEGSSGVRWAVLTVSLSAPTFLPVTVVARTADGTAVSGRDYRPVTRTLTFNPNGSLTQQVRVPIIGNSRPDGDRTFSVKLTIDYNATLAGGSGVVTIVDDD